MIFKNLTFDGISLKEYGVYISGEAVFDSPTREVEMITIPGRNGSFALDKGRFNNITVTYPAGIYATSETEFAEKVSTLRNLLASRKGYCRLTDEYNPDEFRLGVYKAGLELDPTHYNEAGRFELSFDCKPQRFLFSGEEVFTLGEWGQTETKSGSIVSFEGDETTAIKSLTAQIVPKQSGSGDPSPSNVRPISGYDTVNIHVSPTTTAGDGTTYPISLGQTVYGGVLDVVSGVLTITKGYSYLDGTEDWYSVNIVDSNKNRAMKALLKPATGSYDTNLIGNYISAPPIAQGNPDLWKANFNAGGDLVIGIPTSITTVAQWKTYLSSNPLQVVYNLAPTEITLTPTEVQTLLGQNNIWADSGDVTVEIGQNPYILVNPTLFEACPLIEFNSSGEDGEINLGSRQIKVLSAILGRVNLGLDVSGSRTTTRTWQDVITVQNTGSFNAGDDLWFNGGKVIFTFDYVPVNVEVISQGIGMKASWQRGSNNLELSLNNLEFPAGSGTTYPDSCSIKVRASNAPLLEETKTFTATTSYSRDGVLTITWEGGNYSFGRYAYIQGASNYTGYGDSTKNSLEDVDIYIDLDIGEAYSIDSDDNAVSLNNFINLGSELPTLPPGSTTITYSNTISNVEITPRYWRV